MGLGNIGFFCSTNLSKLLQKGMLVQNFEKIGHKLSERIQYSPTNLDLTGPEPGEISEDRKPQKYVLGGIAYLYCCFSSHQK